MCLIHQYYSIAEYIASIAQCNLAFSVCLEKISVSYQFFSYILFYLNVALTKSIGLRTDGRLDDRSYWANRAASLSVSLGIPFVYPRMISIHDLSSKVQICVLKFTVNKTIMFLLYNKHLFSWFFGLYHALNLISYHFLLYS